MNRLNLPASGTTPRAVPKVASAAVGRRRHTRSILLALLSPFLAVVLALRHPRDPSAKNLVWIFTIFYGAVFYIAAGSGDDSVRYAAKLALMHDTDFGLADLVSNFYTDRDAYQDLYQPVVTFLVSRITGNSWLLFGTFGVLLGYVYSRNVWFLIDRVPKRPGVTVWFLVIAFAFAVGIGVSLNGVRMWTALHVFIFGILYFAERKELKFLLIALLSPLIHFSFLIPSALLLAFLFAKRFGPAIYAFFVASFFVAALDVTLIRGAMEYLPQTMSERAIRGYVDRADMVVMGDGVMRPWFLVLNSSLVTAFLFLAATWLFLRRAHERDDVIKFLFLFGMLIYGGVNLVAHIPSAGRFFSIGEMLIIGALVLFLADQARARKLDFQIAGALLPLLAIHAALGIRFFLEYASVWLIVGNFFLAPFVGATEGLYEFVKKVVS